jgi:hypothetical protein
MLQKIIIGFLVPQVDNTIYAPVIFSLIFGIFCLFGIILVFLFLPFIAKIKFLLNFYSKINNLSFFLFPFNAN